MAERSELLFSGGPRFYYDDTLFMPGSDAFLLAAFARVRAGARVCDLGAGTGLLALLLWAREREISLDAVEIQELPLRLAEKTARENGIPLRCHLADLRQLEGILPAASYDLLVCNPPYFKSGSGALSPNGAKKIARTDEAARLEEICSAAARLLKNGGRFALCFRPERLCDLFCALREAGLEPKRLRFVSKNAKAPPKLVLVEGRRGGNPGLAVEAPFFLQEENGQDSAELDAVYFRKESEETTL